MYNHFIRTRTLAWWRQYMKGAFAVYQGLVKRPLTADDKRRLFKRLKVNLIGVTGIGSYRTLALMEHLMGGFDDSPSEQNGIAF